MAGSARTLALLAAVLALAVAANGYFLFEAFKASSAGARYRIVVARGEVGAEARALTAELRAISGVEVVSRDTRQVRRKPTGRFWLGKELGPELGRQVEAQLKGLHFPSSSEPDGEGHVVVHLVEDFPSEGAAQSARRRVNDRLKVITLNVIPAFKPEPVTQVVLDVTVSDPAELRAVQVAAGKRDLAITPVSTP